MTPLLKILQWLLLPLELKPNFLFCQKSLPWSGPCLPLWSHPLPYNSSPAGSCHTSLNSVSEMCPDHLISWLLHLMLLLPEASSLPFLQVFLPPPSYHLGLTLKVIFPQKASWILPSVLHHQSRFSLHSTHYYVNFLSDWSLPVCPTGT